MQSMQIEKNVPMPIQMAKVKFQTDKTIHQVLRAMDTMSVGDSILIDINSSTGKLVTESTLKTWLKKFYINRYDLTSTEYNLAKKHSKKGYDLWMFDYDYEYSERSIDKDPNTKEYSWTSHNDYDRHLERRLVEEKRCEDEDDFRMVEKYLGYHEKYELCTIATLPELIEAAKQERLEKALPLWDKLDFKLKCKIPKPTIENIPLKLDYSKDGKEPVGNFDRPRGYRQPAGLKWNGFRWIKKSAEEEYYASIEPLWGRTGWLDDIHDSHECEFEHPLIKRWNEQEVAKCLGYRLWRI